MLDVEQSGAIAPRAKIIVYQAPNSDPGSNHAWFAAVSDNKADSISTDGSPPEGFRYPPAVVVRPIHTVRITYCVP